tara:strand:+ start:999 stop:1568 length:570 start_codon:yes stop_codon:yes gene_type:complete
MEGKLVIFSAPSGAGKTSIIKYLLDKILSTEFSISATSRKPRENEKNGVDYYFMSVDSFKKKIRNNDFIEFEEVYANVFYGTLNSEVNRILKKNKTVILDMDVKGGLKIKSIFKEKALSIFVKPPSIESLDRRLAKRGLDSKKSIKERLEKSEFEFGFAEKFDIILENKDLDKTKSKAFRIVSEFVMGK